MSENPKLRKPFWIYSRRTFWPLKTYHSWTPHPQIQPKIPNVMDCYFILAIKLNRIAQCWPKNWKPLKRWRKSNRVQPSSSRHQDSCLQKLKNWTRRKAISQRWSPMKSVAVARLMITSLLKVYSCWGAFVSHY